MIKKERIKHLIFFTVLFISFSCEEYLDKTSEADVTKEDVFNTFFSYQGFIETGYAQIVDFAFNPMEAPYFNWGDDVVHASRKRYLQEGDYWPVVNGLTRECVYREQKSKQIYVAGQTIDKGRGIWDNSWHGIRIANIGLEHIDEIIEATIPEKEVLLGQSYFFRGYFHWEIMKQWGDIPYIEKVIQPADEMKIPQLGLYVTIDKVIADLQKAVDLLPVDWDDHPAGKMTIGQNRGRITKGIALAIMSQVQLFAGSPLFNGTATGDFNFNEAYLADAANTSLKIIELANQGVYTLEPFSSYADLFKSVGEANLEPGISKEIIFKAPWYGTYSKYYCYQWIYSRIGGSSHNESPSQNLVELFEMKNGFPIDDPESGFDPLNPWTDLDPRFYFNICKDGDSIAISNPTRAQLFTGGKDRRAGDSSTGYGMTKFTDVTWNDFDGGLVSGLGFHCLPIIRLAEIYLFYAEAVNELYGPSGKMPGTELTAEAALNIVRNRAGMPDVKSKFTQNKEAFRERVRNERSVELAFESKRRDDLRRWYLAHTSDYKDLYSIEFPKDYSFFEKKVVKSIVFDIKHYWFPFPTEQVLLYDGWDQNPGW